MKLAMMLNDALRRACQPHRAVYTVSDDPQCDDHLEITLAGAPTRFNVQVGRGYLCINEYEFENGEISAAVHHGDYRKADAAKCFARVAELLMADAQGDPS